MSLSTLKTRIASFKKGASAAVVAVTAFVANSAHAAVTAIDMTEVNAQLNSIIPLVSAVGQILLIIWAVKKAFRLIKM